MKNVRLTLIQGANELTFSRAIDTDKTSEIAGSLASMVLAAYRNTKRFKINTGICFSRMFDCKMGIEVNGETQTGSAIDVLGFDPAQITTTHKVLRTKIITPAVYKVKVNKEGIEVRGALKTPAVTEKSYEQQGFKHGVTISEKNYMNFVEYVYAMTKAIVNVRSTDLVVDVKEIADTKTITELMDSVGLN